MASNNGGIDGRKIKQRSRTAGVTDNTESLDQGIQSACGQKVLRERMGRPTDAEMDEALQGLIDGVASHAASPSRGWFEAIRWCGEPKSVAAASLSFVVAVLCRRGVYGRATSSFSFRLSFQQKLGGVENGREHSPTPPRPESLEEVWGEGSRGEESTRGR